MNEVEPKKSPMKWIIALVVIVVVVPIFSLVFYYNFLNRPSPEITLVNGHEALQGLNYVYIVDVGVKNNGASGWVKVYAEISGAGRYEKLDKRVYLDSDESKTVKLVFDITLWGALASPSISYNAWAVAD